MGTNYRANRWRFACGGTGADVVVNLRIVEVRNKRASIFFGGYLAQFAVEVLLLLLEDFDPAKEAIIGPRDVADHLTVQGDEVPTTAIC